MLAKNRKMLTAMLMMITDNYLIIIITDAYNCDTLLHEINQYKIINEDHLRTLNTLNDSVSRAV